MLIKVIGRRFYSDLSKKIIFSEFDQIYLGKNSKTNGANPRRWIDCLYLQLSEFIIDVMGEINEQITSLKNLEFLKA